MNVIMRRMFIPVLAVCFVVLSSAAFNGHHYTLISVLLAAFVCLAFFYSLERKKLGTQYAVLIAVMTSLSVVGRFVFAPIPAFKPVTAIVIISGIYLSAEAGFAVGALSALISNMYFGHGAWTPFQMLTWGLIGLFAGFFSGYLKKSRIALLIYGAVSGIIYSLIMDVWTVLWYENGFNVSLYTAALSLSIPYTVVYAVSNVIFLLLIGKSIGRKLSRVTILIER